MYMGSCSDMEDIHFFFFKFLEEFHKVQEKILHPDLDTTCPRSSSVSPLAISDNKGSRITHCLKSRRNGQGKEPLFLDSKGQLFGDMWTRPFSHHFLACSYSADYLPLGESVVPGKVNHGQKLMAYTRLKSRPMSDLFSFFLFQFLYPRNQR